MDDVGIGAPVSVDANVPAERRIRVSAAVITDDSGRLLLVRKRGTTAFMQPGGKPDPGETAAQTLVRELDEEIGIRPPASAITSLGTFTAPAANEPGHLVVADVFRVEIGAAVPVIAAEIAESRWVTRADADEIEIAPLALAYFLPEVTTRPAGSP
ncbi:NUDIX domain-containing protein [Microbacterium sp. cx-55]|uniref:NUDIX hydrolase n=1 Tax=Microbacterium sp. cx-55 TaxID=2875948 RepID=UPI001E3D5333|nr:NUDIX domain-containing protein [Microbacterium sp. cx-55]UGB35132.1 NUDIX domain-containing protein [Microbacterium sp. cx-55]